MNLIVLVLIAALPLFPFLHPGLPITHDGADHVARIANFYQNLSEGNLIPRWAANLNWGYGHPILMFLYPLPSYFASLFHFLSFSFIDSLKIVFALGFIASGAAMYLWLKNFLDKYAAFFGAILYMFAPYRFVDLYVRGAIGEHIAFIFPPLLLYFLLKLSQDSKNKLFYIAGVSLSFSFLILSHNAISLMFIPFIALYIIYLFYLKKNKKFLFLCFLSILLGLGLSFFFWFPAFFEGKYTLRDIVTEGEYIKRFASPISLIFGKWSFGGSGIFSTQIGIIHLIIALISPVVLLKLFKEKSKLLLFFVLTLFYFLFSSFLLLKESNIIYQSITTLQKLQFPWRFLSTVVFSSAILGAFSIYILNKRYQKMVLLLLVLLTLGLSFPYWKTNGYFQKGDKFFSNIYKGTTDTGESSPIWSIRFMEKSAKATIEVISGEASFEKLQRKSTYHSYQVNVLSETARVRENTLYFPNWIVLVDGKETPIEFQDPANRGIITFYVSQGKHKVELLFKDTKLRTVSNVISFTSLLTLVLLFGFHLKLKYEKANN
ncbi:MAG: hypothetical protein A3I49_01060 [Candidatus Levybacteria bacterium RIFCSPLOWO2_02_FULL_37_11]|nr:MAG: hypothetical protein A3I49_01060 [Candidatus Levybacteria bacterium RIFCSPLOWO2_02_FULL_37_11]